MARTKQTKREEVSEGKKKMEGIVVFPKYNPLIITNYRPLPMFKEFCANC